MSYQSMQAVINVNNIRLNRTKILKLKYKKPFIRPPCHHYSYTHGGYYQNHWSLTTIIMRIDHVNYSSLEENSGDVTSIVNNRLFITRKNAIYYIFHRILRNLFFKIVIILDINASVKF